MVDGRERVAGEILVDDTGHALEVLEARAIRHLENLVLDEARIRHEHGDNAPVVERQELQATESRLRHLRREDKRDILRHLRDDARCLLEHLVDALDARPVPAIDELFLLVTHGLRGDQAVYIEAISLRRWDASRGGMQLLEVT